MHRVVSRSALYEPSTEKDSCGVGFVAHIKGEKSRAIVEQALEVLRRLAHRGADWLRPRDRRRRRHPPADPPSLLQARGPSASASTCRAGAATAWAWCSCRRTPFARASLRARVRRRGARARAARHRLARRSRRPFAPRPRGAQRHAVDPTDLHRAPPRGAQRLRAQALRHPQARREPRARRARRRPDGRFHVASLSAETIVYKGLLLPRQLPQFYPDLRRPDIESAIGWCTRASRPTPSPRGSSRSRCASSPTTARSTPCAATATG
jgi:hypothetical protein